MTPVESTKIGVAGEPTAGGNDPGSRRAAEIFRELRPTTSVVMDSDGLFSFRNRVPTVGRRPFSGENFQRCAAGGSSPQNEGGLFPRTASAAGRSGREFPSGDPSAGSKRRAFPPPTFGLSVGTISENIGSMSPDTATEGAGNNGRFLTTRWSLILSSIDGDGEEGKAREALAQLCRIYWRPIFAFICRHGNTLEDAQDLTQDFFLMILKGDLAPEGERGSRAFPIAPAHSAQEFPHRQPRQGARSETRRRSAVRFLG